MAVPVFFCLIFLLLPFVVRSGTPILPLPDLLQPKRLDKYPSPTDSDLHIPSLRKKLGEYYEPALMSIQPKFSVRWKKSMIVAHRIGSRLRRAVLNIRGLNGKKKRKLLKSLARITRCQLYERWEDLGERYWPRWVKQTTCERTRKKSCSIPTGMYCTDGKTVSYKLLYWYCETTKVCNWVKIIWPVTTKCTCACSNY
ncbi:unnamed protein product [Dimorphilus gyrociliatus]|uniref:Uncharacterized protein n=1 Tax=Dimorphilus gyrociliatus TaxID=2664684 RepID=A0A7I8VJU6_9ANNE|nr:unnamed protein product [Dimorphilus gyrociliatus]